MEVVLLPIMQLQTNHRLSSSLGRSRHEFVVADYCRWIVLHTSSYQHLVTDDPMNSHPTNAQSWSAVGYKTRGQGDDNTSSSLPFLPKQQNVPRPLSQHNIGFILFSSLTTLRYHLQCLNGEWWIQDYKKETAQARTPLKLGTGYIDRIAHFSTLKCWCGPAILCQAKENMKRKYHERTTLALYARERMALFKFT